MSPGQLWSVADVIGGTLKRNSDGYDRCSLQLVHHADPVGLHNVAFSDV